MGDLSKTAAGVCIAVPAEELKLSCTCTAWLSTDNRITFSSLSPPPSELVEVSSSVPVALVI